MNKMIQTKYNELQNIMTHYEEYNGLKEFTTCEEAKKYILLALSNTRRIQIFRPKESIDNKFEVLKDLD